MDQLEKPGRRHRKACLTSLALLSLAGLSLATIGCTVQGTGADDDDDSSSAGTDPVVLEIGPGEGIDLKTMTKLSGITDYDKVADVDKLVWPSATPCTPYPGHGDPGEFPATCGDIWAGADDIQFDSFDEAWSALKDIDATGLGSGYYFWSVEGDSDTHWGAVIGASDTLDTYVFWLESVTTEGKIRYLYQKSH